MKRTKYQDGFSLIEIVVGSAVCLMVLVGLLSAFTTIFQLSLANTNKVQAAFLEEEGLDAVRIMRDNGWTANIASKTSGTAFYLNFIGGTWQSTTTNIYVDGTFERKVIISDIYRDANQDIVQNGGSLDPKTKKVAVSISWLVKGATTTQSLSTYITNIFDN